ncbi:hypothetical protein NL533_34300, partial [Klebsiella pneumoniae]|nr:hypothetical protein [Klebsiella pneumoniae]
ASPSGIPGPSTPRRSYSGPSSLLAAAVSVEKEKDKEKDAQAGVAEMQNALQALTLSEPASQSQAESVTAVSQLGAQNAIGAG